MKRTSSVGVSIIAAVSILMLSANMSSASPRSQFSEDSLESVSLILTSETATYSYGAESFSLDLRNNNEALIERIETRADGTKLHMTVIQDVPVNPDDYRLRTFEEIEALPEIGGDVREVTTDDGTSIFEEIHPGTIADIELEPVLYIVQTLEGTDFAVSQGSELLSVSDTTNLSKKTGSRSVKLEHALTTEVQINLERSGIEQLLTVPLSPPETYAPEAVTTTGVDFRYSTFITPNRVSAPFLACYYLPNRTFNGNNRSWRTASNTGYTQDKTRMLVSYTWASKKLHTERFVGKTYRYAPNGTIEASATASNAGQKFTGIQTTNLYLRFVANHSVGNPLCSVAGPIMYTAVVAMWKNGTYSIQGNNVRVPRHEITTRKHGSTVNKIVRRSEAAMFICLNAGPPICPSAQSFNLSGTY